MSISYIHRPFFASHSCIHIAILDFSPKNAMRNYTDKTNIVKGFHFESVKSFIQSTQT